jgi:hypothetical protein
VSLPLHIAPIWIIQVYLIRSGPFVKSESDWGLVRHGVPQGSILGTLLFLLYINDLPSSIKLLNVNVNPQTTLFANDTSVIVSNQNNIVLRNNLKLVFTSVMKWFRANLLSLNLDKTYCMEFHSKYTTKSGIQIKYNDKKITNTTELKFLGLVLHNTMSSKRHFDMLAPKFNKACYIARAIKPFLSLNSLKIIYQAYFHSVITYGLIFWGTSPYSTDIFKLQKRMIRIIMEARPRDSCRQLFKILKI